MSCVLKGQGHGTSQFLARKTQYGYDLFQGCHMLTAERTPAWRDIPVHGRPQAELSQYHILDVCWDPVSKAKYRITPVDGLAADPSWHDFSDIASHLSSDIPWMRQAVRNLNNLKPMPVNGLDAQKRWEQAKERFAWWSNPANVRKELGTDSFSSPAPCLPAPAPQQPKPAAAPVRAIVCAPIVLKPAQPTLPGCGRVRSKGMAKAQTLKVLESAQIPLRMYDDNIEKSRWHVQIPNLSGIYALVARSQYRKPAAPARYHNSAPRKAEHRPMMALA